MKLPSIVLFAATILVASVSAQEPAESDEQPATKVEQELANSENPVSLPVVAEPMERVILFDSSAESSPSDLRPPAESSKWNAAELRQARAMYEAEQRVKRLETNRWLGYEPLRPNWPMTPVMSSRYPARRTIYVPVYIYTR
jgi:hypothetical protein